MTKYSFVIFHKEADMFLQNLQELGVVDVTRHKRAVDTWSKERFEEIAEYNAAIKSLEKLKADAQKQRLEIPVQAPQTPELLSLYKKSTALKEQLNLSLKDAKSALTEATPWGAFREDDLQKLKAINLIPHFYCVAQKRFNPTWENEYALHLINTVNEKTYFMILQSEGEPYAFGESECVFPETPADVLIEKIADLEKKIAENQNLLLSLTRSIEQFEMQKGELFSELDVYLATNRSQKEAEETVFIFEAFAPSEIDDKVDRFLEENNVYYFKGAAQKEDNPPVKLKNNFFGKLYEPIGELYMLPNYGELDLTIFFAPFYMLFFGLCLGDMGYGLILILAGLFVNFKVPKFANYGKLVAWLGMGAVVMPALNGTFFGAKLYEIFPIPANITELFFTDMKMFWFAIIFGLVQIVFARLLNAVYMIKTKGISAGLGNIGWALLIAWGALAYAAMEMKFSYPEWVNYIGYLALALIIGFGSMHKNIVVRVLKGAGSLYDVTGVFGDMLSYIRLFGLGTAGGILGLVVNSVAMQMSDIPYLGWFFTLLMLLIGHTAVLFLSSLGAFVHPMRLTFVEFYKNAGFEGGGRPYAPLAKTKKN